MKALAQRIGALEQRQGVGIRRWRRVVVQAGESHDDARARYEQDNGPLGPDEGLMIRHYVSSGEIAASGGAK